jgi:O-antigen/teichoic acid export membrane protein
VDKTFVKKFLKGSASTAVGTLMSVVIHFLSITLMARVASEEVLGVYFLILAIANGGKIVASLGLDLTLVQFLVSETESVQQQTFAAVIWFRLIILLLIALLTLLLGGPLLAAFNGGISAYRWTIPILIAMMSFRELLFYILQGLEKYRLYAFVQTSSAVLKLGLVALLLPSLSLMTLIFIEFAMLGGSLVLQIYAIPFKRLSPPSFLFEKSIVPKIFRFGLPLYANSIFTYISNYGAIFIVGLFLTPAAIAAYEIARKIPEGLMRLFASFRVVYFPSMSSLFAKDDIKNAQKLMNKSLIVLAAGTFAIVLGGLLFSREIVLLVFPKYLEVQPTFVLLMFAVCTHLLASTMGYSLVSAGYPARSTQINIMAMSIELGLSLLLIPQIGYIGAAVSYIVMTFLSQTLSYFYLRRADVNLRLQSYLAPFVLLAITSGTYILVGSENLLWRFALLGAYVAACFFFVSEFRHAIQYIWNMFQEFDWQRKPKLKALQDE